MTTIYQVLVDGEDVTNGFDTVMISISVTLDDQGTTDSAEFELNDTDGMIALPRNGATIEVNLGDDVTGVSQVFTGFVDTSKSGGSGKGSADKAKGNAKSGGDSSIHSSGSRSKGRTLTMSAKSADMTSKVKEKAHRHKDNASFGDVAQEWGQMASLAEVKVDSALSGIQRPYWYMSGESYMAWGERMAHQLGATFKIYGTEGVFVSRSGGQSVSGADLTDVLVTWGDNLIEWSASPVKTRPEYGPFKTRWYDPVAAQCQIETSSASGPGSVNHEHPFKAPAKDHAQKQSDANQVEGDREKGGADSVTIEGDITAQPGANCILSGIRPGVDGVYLISSVTHTLNRSKGFTTEIKLKQPTGSAGTDSR